MAAVVPWPASQQDAGWVNLAYSYVDSRTPDGKRGGKFPVANGWPFKAVDQLVSRAAWTNMQTLRFKDQWYCLSLQATVKADPNRPGKFKAQRGAAHALKVKAIWVDIDVDPSGGTPAKPKYKTIEDALKAVIQFREKAGLPPFSALVGSGSGLHAYWINDATMTPAEWAPYAHGLKSLLMQEGVLCDAGLTTDVARILRIPGTFNHKYDPPKPVQLLNLPLVTYNFPTTLAFLTQIAPTATVGGAPPAQLFADAASAAAFKAGPAFKIDDGTTLQAGINKFDDTLLPISPIFKECGMYRNELRTGGKDAAQPLWMLAVLGTTFMENGNAIAHEISKGHEAYTADDTQALYDRKVADRHDRGVGYPSCAAFAGAGSTSCATCPLLAKGKSPLNIRAAFTATVTPPPAGPPQSPSAQALNLPPNYEVDGEGIICRVIEKLTREGETVTTLIPMFQRKLRAFWPQKGNSGDILNYTVEVDKGFVHGASVPAEEFMKQGFAGYLMNPAVRTLPHPDGAQYIGAFFMSMLGKLWKENSAQQAIPFGWYMENGAIKGFAYGGNIHMADGSTTPCGVGDPVIRATYTPQGDIQPWFDAAKTVTGRQRPELTAIMLMSFASPLLQLTGHNSVMLSAWGDSGAGKSAAYKAGMAVWGDPLLSKGSETSTRNSVTSQMKEIMNLPFYWDEITDDTHREMVAKVMHEASDGTEKGRMLNGRQQQARGKFKLMLMQASNGSYREYLSERNKSHIAGQARVLEWHVRKVDGGPGHLSDVVATQLLSALEHNYGMMGLRYASWLAQNHAMITDDITKMSLQVQNDTAVGGNAERYWIAGVTVMILAARYAKLMGVEVDELEIQDFMYEVMREQIAALDKIGGIAGLIDHTETALARYLKERGAEERAIWTNYIHLAQGKAPKPVMILKGPTQPRNNAGGVEVRVSVDDRLVIIAQQDFNAFIKAHKFTKAQVHKGLERDFNAIFKDKVRLLSGTVHGGATPLREPVIMIPVDPLSPLWDFLQAYSSPEDKLAAEAAVPPPAVDTGLAGMEPMGNG